jgi:tetratricopeptide (TPR) repeat protein
VWGGDIMTRVKLIVASLLFSCVSIFHYSEGMASESAENHFEKGKSHYFKKSYDEAIAELTKAIEIDARYIEAYMYRGKAYFGKGEYGNAIEDFTRVLQSRDDHEALSWRGLAYLKTGQADNAISDYTRAIELSPDDVTYYEKRAEAYIARMKYDLAIADYDRVIDMWTDAAMVYPGADQEIAAAQYKRGLAYMHQHKFTAAYYDLTAARNSGYPVDEKLIEEVRQEMNKGKTP